MLEQMTKNLNRTQQGILLVLLGLVVVLYALGFLEWVNSVVVALGAAMMILGLQYLHAFEKLRALFTKKS